MPLKTRGKCAPALWGKMSKIEQTLWADFYETFIFEGNFPPGWEDEKKRDVVAHNLACQAVWLLKSYIIPKGK